MILKEQHESEDGTSFRAFANGCVRVLFPDRTILELSPGRDQVDLILPDGTSERLVLESSHANERYGRAYVAPAIEFSIWAFASPTERLQLQLARKYRHQRVAQELYRYRYLHETSSVESSFATANTSGSSGNNAPRPQRTQKLDATYRATMAKIAQTMQDNEHQMKQISQHHSALASN